MSATTENQDLAAATAQILINNDGGVFSGRPNVTVTIPRWNALNRKQCAIRLTSGASVLVELIEHDGDYNVGKVYARKPMVRTIAEAAHWIAEEETIWMDRNNAAA
ncbi:MAG: hypothetical protein QM680_14005 [Luteolibacter sp.]